MKLASAKRCDMPTRTLLSQVQQEVAEVLACLDDALVDLPFRLAVAALVTCKNCNGPHKPRPAACHGQRS